MSKLERYNNRLLRENKVVIPFTELNYQLIPRWIFRHRMARIFIFLLGASISYSRDSSLPMVAGPITGAITSNPLIASLIQKVYSEIDFSQPIFSVAHEHKYPEGWISAARIKETHPIFYIDMKGNFVFLKPSRMEYYRYLFQKSVLGKLGYNTWWLRGYLEPPKAPESVKKWAQEKVKKMMERMKPAARPVPRPALVRVSDTKFGRKQPTSLRRQRIQ